MNKITTLLNVLLILLAVSIHSCKKDKNDDQNLQLTFEKQDYYPLESALLQATNTTITDGEYSGNISGTAITLVSISGSLATVIPNLGAGTHKLTANINGKEFSATFNLLPSPSISNPDAIRDTYLQTVNQAIQSLTQAADSLDPAQKAELLAATQTLQHYTDSIHQRYNSLSPQEKEECARFLAANEWWLNELNIAVNDFFSNSFSFKTQDAIEDFEFRRKLNSEKFVSSNFKVISSIAKIAAFTAAGALLGPIGAGIGLGIAITRVVSDAKKHGVATEELISGVIQPFQNLFGSGKTNAFIPFTHNAAKNVTITMEYRSLYSADKNASSPIVKNVVTGLDKLKSTWNSILNTIQIFSIFKPKTVDDIQTYKTETRQVNSKYISISNIDNTKVTLQNTDKTDGLFKLTFRNSETTPQNFSFIINYSSEFGAKTETLEAEVTEWSAPKQAKIVVEPGSPDSVLYTINLLSVTPCSSKWGDYYRVIYTNGTYPKLTFRVPIAPTGSYQIYNSKFVNLCDDYNPNNVTYTTYANFIYEPSTSTTFYYNGNGAEVTKTGEKSFSFKAPFNLQEPRMTGTCTF